VAGFPEYEAHDAVGLAELVQRKEVHPTELVEEAIRRVERYNPALNAVIDTYHERAHKAASGPLPQGPLAGVPYLVKDMVAHAGTRLTFGTALLLKANLVPEESHEVVRRSEEAGLIVVGKTNACELGLLPTTEPEAYGPTHNPWALAHSPGGSSGGTAAAVAARMVPMAHGNDGGGSIRIPASTCGLFGLKPSRGRNPGFIHDLPDGIAVEHCLSRSVRDSAALLDITRGPLPGDRWWAPPPERPYMEDAAVDPGQLRIGFTTSNWVGRPAHPDCVAAIHDAARLCQELGHDVEEARPELDGQRYYEAFVVLWSAMPHHFFKIVVKEALRKAPWLGPAARLLGDGRVLDVVGRLMTGDWRRAPMERVTRELAALGARHRPADLWHAWSDLQQASSALGRFHTQHDLFLTPVLGEPPLRTGELTELRSVEAFRERALSYAGYTSLANTSGVPAMSVPLHWNDRGLPIGVQFVGRFGEESTLFRLAGQLERARPWGERWPGGLTSGVDGHR
jgi:amidase